MMRGCDADEEELGLGDVEERMQGSPPLGSTAQTSTTGLCGGDSCGTCGDEEQGCQSADKLDPSVDPSASPSETAEARSQGANGSTGRSGAVCLKCKEAPAEVIANQREPMCAVCLRNSLLGKFKTTVNKHNLIARHDRVLLAFSGGHASRCEIRRDLGSEVMPITKTDKTADRGRTIFQLGVIFVDESAATGASPAEAEGLAARVRAATRVPRSGQLATHVVPLEYAFSEGGSARSAGTQHAAARSRASEEGEEGGASLGVKAYLAEDTRRTTPFSDKVPAGASPAGAGASASASASDGASDGVGASAGSGGEVVADSEGASASAPGASLGIGGVGAAAAVAGPSGREAAAFGEGHQAGGARLGGSENLSNEEQGYTKVVLGLCTSRIAVRALTATVKGRGYGLSADMQASDARWRVPVVLPLKECVSRELALLCRLARLETVFVRSLSTLTGVGSSINALTDAFVMHLQGLGLGLPRPPSASDDNDLNGAPKQTAAAGAEAGVGAGAGAVANGHGPKMEPHPPLPQPLPLLPPLCAICSAPLPPGERVLAQGASLANGGSRGGQTPKTHSLGASSGAESSKEGESESEYAEDARDFRGVSRSADKSSLVAGTGDDFAGTCCRSCRFQILGENPAAAAGGELELEAQTEALLPKAWVDRSVAART
eukprot:jgi/Mesen1/1446/ME000132S00387